MTFNFSFTLVSAFLFGTVLQAQQQAGSNPANNMNVLSNLSNPGTGNKRPEWVNNPANGNFYVSPSVQVQQGAVQRSNLNTVNQRDNAPGSVNKNKERQKVSVQPQVRAQAQAPVQQLALVNDNNNADNNRLQNYSNLNTDAIQIQTQNVQTPVSQVSDKQVSASSSSGFSMPSLKLRMPSSSQASASGKSTSHTRHSDAVIKHFWKKEEVKFRKSMAHSKKIKVNYELCFSWK